MTDWLSTKRQTGDLHNRSAKRRVTLADVAAHAGVSRATASLVVRNAGNLADSTRRRVRDSMDTLGYVYHRGAASLRQSRTKSVGLVVPDMANGFTAEMTIGLESALAESGFVTLMGNSLESIERQTILLKSMLERQVDGIVIIPAVGSADALQASLSAGQVPVVVATRDIGGDRFSYVGIDNEKGGRLAGEHLIFHGCQRLAYLGGFAELGPRRDRIHGVRKAVEIAGRGTLEVEVSGPSNGGWGLEAGLDLIRSGPIPEGIVCHNDLVAFGLFRALRQEKPTGWERTRVISYDDVAAASLWEPPLTTVAANGHEVGERCARSLLRLTGGDHQATERVLITSQLVVRQSCGCP